MTAQNDNKEVKTGLYERTVGSITEWVKPYLHKKTEAFIEKSIDKYAGDDPRFARMIEFEVKRRGDGAGLTQDVAEPLLWVGVKTAAALVIAAISESLHNNRIKLVGRISALGIVLNNAVELFRLVPRYVAGLQGSLEMAKDRQKSIDETGIDPFDHGGRLIHKSKDDNLDEKEEKSVEATDKWQEMRPKRDILAVSDEVAHSRT